jgi:hypothetical protein
MSNLKKDMSNLRYELITKMQRHDEAHDVTHKKVVDVEVLVGEAEQHLMDSFQVSIMHQKAQLEALQAEFEALRSQMDQLLSGHENLSDELRGNVSFIMERVHTLATRIEEMSGSIEAVKAKLGVRQAASISAAAAMRPEMSPGFITEYGTPWHRQGKERVMSAETRASSSQEQRVSRHMTSSSSAEVLLPNREQRDGKRSASATRRAEFL